MLALDQTSSTAFRSPVWPSVTQITGAPSTPATRSFEHPLRGIERFAAAQFQRHELLLAVGKDSDHAENWRADDLPGAAHPQRDRIEVQPEDIHSAGERVRQASSSTLSVPTTRETALFERGAALSQGTSGGGHHGCVHLAHAALVAAHERRRPLPRPRGPEPRRAWPCEGQRPGEPGQDAPATPVRYPLRPMSRA